MIKEALADKENVQFLLMENRGHNPNYTEDAVRYLNEFMSARTKKTKKKELETQQQKTAFINSYDWNRMMAQDEAVWNEIFKTLDTI